MLWNMWAAWIVQKQEGLYDWYELSAASSGSVLACLI
jgi:hypothetical protein